MKASIVVHRDAEKIPRSAEIKIGRKKLKVKYLYSPDGDAYTLEVEGRKEDLPNLTDVLKIVDAKRLDRIGTIELIDLITEISEITTIKTIESIESLPNITVQGSEGIAVKQATAASGSWQDPDGFSDPDGVWTNEANAYDNDTGTWTWAPAFSSGWKPFLYLTYSSAVKSNKLRFYVFGGGFADRIDVDAKIDGNWINVYEGSVDSDIWVEKSFSEGDVDEVRFRFHFPSDAGFPVSYCVKEVDVWQVPSTGGELIIHVAKDKTLKTAKIECSSSGDNQIVAAVSGKKIKVYAIKLVFNVSGGVNAKFRSATTDLEGAQPFSDTQGYTETVTPPAFLLETAAGEALNLNLSATANARGRVSYWDDDAT